MYISCTVPGSPVQNVMISNVIDGDGIAVLITWDPPSVPNGIIRYYRVEFEQVFDPLDHDGSGMDDAVMNVSVVITSGSGDAPTNVTLSDLG